MRRPLGFTFTIVLCFASPLLATENPTPQPTTLPAPTTTTSTFTNHDYRDALMNFNERTLVEEYDAFGNHDPKWDDVATEFLTSITTRFTDLNVEDYYRAGIVYQKELASLAQKVHSTGCTDPLVLYCYAVTMKEANQNTEYHNALAQAANGMLASKYGPFRQSNAYRAYMSVLNATHSPDAKAWEQRFIDQLAQSLASSESPLDRRIKMTLLQEELPSLSAGNRTTLINKIAAIPNADKWTQSMITGLDEIAKAWVARGPGYADTVTDARFAGFNEHLSKARTALLAAYRLEPTYPESSVAMITASFNLSNAEQQTREWFDRSIKAQIDFTPAWTAYLYALSPHWFGSTDKMYALGCEALDTKRFDTSVPYFFRTALNAIVAGQNGDYSIYRRPDAWPRLKAMTDGYLARPYPALSTKSWLAYKLGDAFRAGQYERATDLQKRLTTFNTAFPLAQYATTPQDVANTCAAMTSDRAAQLKIAYDAELARHWPAAADAYSSLASVLPDDHPATPFVHTHLQLCKAQADLAADKLIELPFSADGLKMWRGDLVDWKTDGITLSLTSKPKVGSTIQYTGNVPHDFRINIEWSSQQPATSTTQVFTLFFSNIDAKYGSYFGVGGYQDGKLVMPRTLKSFIGKAKADNLPQTPDNWHHWIIERDGDTLTVTQDDKVIIDHYKNNWVLVGKPMLSLNVKDLTPNGPGGGTVRLRNLTIEGIHKNIQE